MKTFKLISLLFILVGLWTFLIWKDPFGTPLNSDSRPQNEGLSSSESNHEASFVYSYSKEDKNTELYTTVIEGCEYIKIGSGRARGYVHKGNCKNKIHPENTVDWVKFNKLLNSPLLTNILEP